MKDSASVNAHPSLELVRISKFSSRALGDYRSKFLEKQKQPFSTKLNKSGGMIGQNQQNSLSDFFKV